MPEEKKIIGFTLTGEWRVPRAGEWFFDLGLDEPRLRKSDREGQEVVVHHVPHLAGDFNTFASGGHLILGPVYEQEGE